MAPIKLNMYNTRLPEDDVNISKHVAVLYDTDIIVTI